MNSHLITIYCRRCRAEISSAQPGALIGCAMGCRLLTRATLTHTQQPQTRITVRQVIMGYQIFLTGGWDFDSILGEFKLALPRATRRFMGNHWHVEKRAEAKLERFLSSVAARAVVIREAVTAQDLRAS